MSNPPSTARAVHDPATRPTPGSGHPAPMPLPLTQAGTPPTPVSLLVALARVGSAAPEHLVALLRRAHPDAMDLVEVLAVQQLLIRMQKEGRVRVSWCAVHDAGLRTYEHTVLRLTDAGRQLAAAGRGRRAKLLTAIAELQPDYAGGWLLRETVRATALSHWAHAKHVGAWLRARGGDGLMEARETRPERMVPVVSLTDTGRAWVEQEDPAALAHLPRLATPPEFVTAHHLHTVRAACWVMAALNPPRPLFLHLEGDTDMRVSGRRGRRTRRRTRYAPVPDGRLHMLRGGQIETRDIEVIGGYTAEQIESKFRTLAPDTIYFATCDAVADRVAALGYPRPRVI